MMRKLRKFFIFLFLALVSLGATIFICNYIIEKKSEPYIFDYISQIPSCKTALLLGTSKTLKNGYSNLYFSYRIDAAERLYKSGKITYILISGDNSRKDYSEPEDMQAELLKRGIPLERIYLDYAGFRTLDSVLRAKELFGQEKYIIISQKFHNERAVYLARKNGIEAYGYNAQDVNKYYGFKTKVREYFARTKVFLDLLLDTQPKYGGDKIIIP